METEPASAGSVELISWGRPERGENVLSLSRLLSAVSWLEYVNIPLNVSSILVADPESAAECLMRSCCAVTSI
jgi:hypothetical protein